MFVQSHHVNVPKEHEYEMRYGTPSRSNDFQPCVSVRGVHLEFCGELFIAWNEQNQILGPKKRETMAETYLCEEQDLNRRTRTVPPRPRDSILVSHCTRL